MPKQLVRMYLFYFIVFSFIGFLMFFGVNGDGGSPETTTTVIGDTKKSTDNINIIKHTFDPNSYYTPKLLKEIEQKVKEDKEKQLKEKQLENKKVKKNKTTKKEIVVEKKKEKVAVAKKSNKSSRVESYLNRCNNRKGKFTLSHYNNNGGGGHGITASGKRTQHGFTASNNVLYGKRIKITMPNGTVMYRTVHDTGSERHMGYGNCKVDIFVNVSTKEVYRLGLKKGAIIEVVE